MTKGATPSGKGDSRLVVRFAPQGRSEPNMRRRSGKRARASQMRCRSRPTADLGRTGNCQRCTKQL